MSAQTFPLSHDVDCAAPDGECSCGTERTNLSIAIIRALKEEEKEVARLRDVIKTGGAMLRAERAALGVPGGIETAPPDLIDLARAVQSGHVRSYVDAAKKLAEYMLGGG